MYGLQPKCRSNIVAQKFPSFTINNEPLQFIQEFKGHILSNIQLDDADIARERKNLFYRCNMLIRRFYNCSVAVKQRLFKSFCLCFYDVALWSNFTAFSYNKLKSTYVKCCKIFCGYNKYYSVTAMLHELDFSDFNTVIGSHQHALHRQI